MVEPELIPYLKELYFDLHENRLEVVLVPSRISHGCIRAATSRNPKWYRELCSHYPDTRGTKKKPRTIIKRITILGVLETLIKRHKSSSKHADYLIDQARLLKESNDMLDGIQPYGGQF